MISEKYIAGFLDSDGCVSLDWYKGRPSLVLSFSQKTSQDEVLYLIQKDFTVGFIRYNIIKGNSYTFYCMKTRQAEKILNRIKKHLVIKRHYAESCLYLVNQKKSFTDWEDKKRWLKEQRKILSVPLPNYPSRKWLAGYIDGDGCFSVMAGHKALCGKTNKLYVVVKAQIEFSISSSWYDAEGLRIIQKAFGGSITVHTKSSNNLRIRLALNPSKAIQLFDYCGKYFVVKKDQADFILGCAKMGHYRDGKRIKAILKQLKAKDHRLNEPNVNIKRLLSHIRSNILKDGTIYKGCSVCGNTERKHAGRGMCRNCCRKIDWRMRKSAQAIAC